MIIKDNDDDDDDDDEWSDDEKIIKVYTDLHRYHSMDGRLSCHHGSEWGRGRRHLHSPWLVEDSRQYRAYRTRHKYHRTNEEGHGT